MNSSATHTYTPNPNINNKQEAKSLFDLACMMWVLGMCNFDLFHKACFLHGNFEGYPWMP